MRRRAFIGTLALGGLAAGLPRVARAQQSGKPALIGMLMATAEQEPDSQARMTAFRRALQELGWTDGRSARIETRWFAGDYGRAKAYAKELVGLACDVIVAHSTLGIEAVIPETGSIPIVFVLVGFPVGSGYVASLARPGGNMTGFSAFEPEIGGKWLQALKEAAPGLRRDRKSTRLNSSHIQKSRMPSSA